MRRQGVADRGCRLRVDDLSNLARFVPVPVDKIRERGISRARLLLDREFFKAAGGADKERFREITPCRSAEAVKKALAKLAETGKRTCVVCMAVTGKDCRQAKYRMRIGPRKKCEESGKGDGKCSGKAGSSSRTGGS